MKLARFFAFVAVAACGLLVSACGNSERVSSIPAGGGAYAVAPAADPAALRRPYVIAPRDVLSLEVFQEPEFSKADLQVDNLGNIQLPFIGNITAAGQTSEELASVIAARLRTRYIVNPQVIVTVVRPATRFVTVEGQVKDPGVYEIDQNYTLLSAIARAKSTSKTAKLDEVLIFRNVGSQRMAARFDLGEIRAGRAPDPQVVGGDVIVVANSGIKSAWQDILQALPLLNVFYVFRN
ncbi:MAG: polysaccharide biosynthesis/export family protein [Novosphingobium sp.]